MNGELVFTVFVYNVLVSWSDIKVYKANNLKINATINNPVQITQVESIFYLRKL